MCNNMDEPAGQYAKQNKLDTEKTNSIRFHLEVGSKNIELTEAKYQGNGEMLVKGYKLSFM